MERKIGRINEAYQNKKSKQLNSLLLVISVLSLASVLNDVSQWMINMGASELFVYNPVYILSSVCFLAAVGWLILRNRK